MTHSDTVEHAKVRLLCLASQCNDMTPERQNQLVEASRVYADAMAVRCGACLAKGFLGYRASWGSEQCPACGGTGKRMEDAGGLSVS